MCVYSYSGMVPLDASSCRPWPCQHKVRSARNCPCHAPVLLPLYCCSCAFPGATRPPVCPARRLVPPWPRPAPPTTAIVVSAAFPTTPVSPGWLRTLPRFREGGLVSCVLLCLVCMRQGQWQVVVSFSLASAALPVVGRPEFIASKQLSNPVSLALPVVTSVTTRTSAGVHSKPTQGQQASWQHGMAAAGSSGNGCS